MKYIIFVFYLMFSLKGMFAMVTKGKVTEEFTWDTWGYENWGDGVIRRAE